MTRTISKAMSGILEDLELDNKSYVTLKELQAMAERHGVRTEPTMIASRLKQSGWLIPTAQRGVWEFAPAAVAGSFSRNDPLREIRAFRIAHPQISCYLCLQTAAWAMGLADRVPEEKELAFAELPRKHIPDNIRIFRFAPEIDIREVRGVHCLAPESMIVQLSAKPDIVKTWESVMEWLPDVVYEADLNLILKELEGRNDSVKRRTGYLLQGMYPDAAEEIWKVSSHSSKIRFGPRSAAIRNDEKWKIADTILPFSPKDLEKVK